MHAGNRDRLRRAADREGAARPVPVDAEALGAGDADERFLDGGDHGAQSRRILLEAASKTLIGDVDDGQQAAARHHLGDRRPVGIRQRRTGGIVAAGMQQHRISLLRLFESGQHVLDQHPLGGDVEEGIGDDIEAGGLEDRRMVRPAGQTEMNAPASEPGGEVGGKLSAPEPPGVCTPAEARTVA